MTRLWTLAARAEGFLETKGSKFLCALVPYAQYPQALAAAKRQHAKASHIIPIYRWTENNAETRTDAAHSTAGEIPRTAHTAEAGSPTATPQLASASDLITVHEGANDDGEPSGTAGRPCLAVLQGRNLVNVGAYVVRYFGGTKLGTGPLARAYAGCVRDALDGARLVPWEPSRELIVPVAYDAVPVIELEIRRLELAEAKVEAEVEVEAEAEVEVEVEVERRYGATQVAYVFAGGKSQIDRIEAALLAARIVRKP